MRSQPHVLGIVLAGGEGKRLYPLTADRAKPAVPFGGAYRLIDFVLSNLVNAGYLRICVLTQYKSHSLDRHISQTWRLSGFAGEYITPVPASSGSGRAGTPAVPMQSCSRSISFTTRTPSTSWFSVPTTCTGWIRNRWFSTTSNPGQA
ncbi:sugar phosphate nucleotidyltransferase [Rhodococcus sp. 3Y1]